MQTCLPIEIIQIVFILLVNKILLPLLVGTCNLYLLLDVKSLA